MEQYIQEYATPSHSNEEDLVSLEKLKPVSATIDGPENTETGGFDCNICLDFVQDPVVTFCGHLYCWPCIYKWIHFQSLSSENPKQQQPQCPVCKAEISQRTLVPLYGRGRPTKLSNGKAQGPGLVIPKRPPSDTSSGQQPSSRPVHQSDSHSYLQQPQPPYHYLGGYSTAAPVLNIGGTRMPNIANPMIGMLGEMVSARIFGNSYTTLHAHPNSYHVPGISNPRMRRRMDNMERSLGRVWFFLCCCVILCLLLF